MTWNEIIGALEANIEDDPFMVRFEVFDETENEYLTYELFHDLWGAKRCFEDIMLDKYVIDAWSTRDMGAEKYELMVYFKKEGAKL